MSASLQVCAAGLLVICVGCGVYLSRPSSSLHIAVVPEPARLSAEMRNPTSVASRQSDFQSDFNERQAGVPASKPAAVVTYREDLRRGHADMPFAPLTPPASMQMTSTSSPRVANKINRTEPPRAAEGSIGNNPLLALPTPDRETPFVVELAVPFGASLPATFLDSAVDATPAQIAAMDRIASDFVQNASEEDHSEADATASLTAAGGKPRKASLRPNWDSAAANANEQYRLLFGVEAYNARTAAAAREALEEQQGRKR